MESLTGTAELEIKLRLPRKAVANVLRHPALTELKAGRARRRRLVSTYFDTPNLRLATAGVGLRIVVPMLGPVPIALDFGFPIVKAPEDREQIFSFWIGFFH